VKKENRKVNDSFILRFLKLQEKISTLKNAWLLICTIQPGYSARGEKIISLKACFASVI